MNRRQIRFLAFSLAVLSLAAIGWMVVRTVREHRVKVLQHLALRLLTGADQRIQNFHRVSMRDGMKVWEIAAREARYFKKEGMVVVYGPEVAFYPNGGEPVSIRGEEGRLYLDGQDIERMTIRGGLEVRFAGLRLTAEQAIYERREDRIVSPGWVEIAGRGWTIRGQGGELSVGGKRLRLVRKVETVIQARPG